MDTSSPMHEATCADAGRSEPDAPGAPKTGVLFLNTGTPDAPEERAIAAYLDEFLMDPAIIGAPRPIRRLIVNRIVKTRPAQTAERYRSFWTDAGSPFLLACQAQARALEAALNKGVADGCSVANAPGMPVVLAMRYGNPSIASGLARLREAGCERIVALPAYPQYVSVCAGTCLSSVRDTLRKMGWRPDLVEIRSFHDLHAYRRALARSVSDQWEPGPRSALIVSCHSTLLKDIERGDPYRDQVEQTARNLAADLGIEPHRVLTAYQSRFDDRKWLQPFTESEVRRLAEAGVTDLAIVCPIFTADNLETRIDVDRELRAVYGKAAPAGSRFTYIPCLNEDPLLIEAFAQAVRRQLADTTAPSHVG